LPFDFAQGLGRELAERQIVDFRMAWSGPEPNLKNQPFESLTALSGSTLLTALSSSKGSVEGHFNRQSEIRRRSRRPSTL
jgi:hypothetical protein